MSILDMGVVQSIASCKFSEQLLKNGT